LEVPEVLLSGDHRKIERWRRREALRNTLAKRPDLLRTAVLTDEDRKVLLELEKETTS
jgi:tRNA (guanine37-N1)-methyltransferase